jgi:hypothetical protein
MWEYDLYIGVSAHLNIIYMTVYEVACARQRRLHRYPFWGRCINLVLMDCTEKTVGLLI